MAQRPKPVPIQRVFEARYEQGYRYLDRCGDAMILLERVLGDQTGLLWIPGEAKPTGGRITCPELDLTIAFDAYRIAVQQIGKTECDFDNISTTALATITGRFDLKTMSRFGARRVRRLGADSIDDAGRLSIEHLPISKRAPRDWVEREYEFAARFETPDRMQGIRVVAKPEWTVAADLAIDERLLLPPHQLPEGQHSVLLEQLKRARKREKDPEAGLTIDIDYYRLWPPKEATAAEFLAAAWNQITLYEDDLVLSKKR